MSLEHFHLTLVFLSSLCVGSFLNVVIYRLPLKQNLAFPRSNCPNCRKIIPWYFNIPVFSFFWLRGKCASCQTAISFRYPFVEVLTALIFTLAAKLDPNMIAWPFHFFFLGALIACAFIDLQHWILPDKITLPGICLGLLASLILPEKTFLDSILGVIAGGGTLYLVAWAYLTATGKDGLGGGDIKFLAMVGAFLGVKGALVTLVFASLVGSILGIFLILVKKKKSGTAIPFGPFLSGGALLAFFFGDQVWQWYFGFY